jgi:hypothetical protein
VALPVTKSLQPQALSIVLFLCNDEQTAPSTSLLMTLPQATFPTPGTLINAVGFVAVPLDPQTLQGVRA